VSRPPLLFALALAPALCAPAAAAPAPFSEEIVAVKARRIETASKGTIENGVIVIRNGKIAAVGTDVKIPAGALILEAAAVMPGIVGVYSQVGLSGSGGAGPEVALSPGFGSPTAAASNAHYRVLDELYPFDTRYERLLRAGVTTLALVPGGRGINGQGAVVKPAGGSVEQMVVLENAPLAVGFGTGTQAQDLIRNAFNSARSDQQPPGPPAPAAEPKGTPAPQPKPGDEDAAQRRRPPAGRPQPAGGSSTDASGAVAAARRAALTRAVDGAVPTFIACADPAGAIYALQLFQAYERLKPVFVLTSECYRVADRLGEKKASIVLPADITFEPNSRTRINVPEMLARAGAKVACRPPSDDVEGYESLRFKMAELVRAGLDRDLALKAITLHPAEMLGAAARIGSIEVGRDGNLLLLDGDPFAALTRVRQVVLEGKVVWEEDPAMRAAPPAEVTVIVGGDVWTVTRGVVRGGTVILKGTKIDRVGGPDLAVPAGARVIDAKGKVVAPGFVAAMTSSGFGASSFVGTGGGQIKDALDPFTLSVSLALATGVTTLFVPSGGSSGDGGSGSGSLSSSNAALRMSEGDVGAMMVKEPVLSTFSVGGAGLSEFGGGRFGSGEGSLSARWNLREQLRRAKEYQQKYERYEQEKKAGKMVAEPKKPGDIDAALPLVRRERLLRVTASTVTEIRWALRLVDDFGLRIAITPATEAWIIADEIARRSVPLIITARSRVLPDDRKNGPSGANPDAPGILRKAGVRFAVVPPSTLFSTGGLLGRDMLTFPLEAAFAMRGGLDAQSALESITIVPAEILGIADRVGSIEEGKEADLLVLDGDPLDYRTFVEKTFVNGRLRYDKDQSPFFAHVRRQRDADGREGTE
jgi:imidazolonepropionase-like amidohydrolase